MSWTSLVMQHLEWVQTTMKDKENVYPKIKKFVRKNVSLEITIYVIKTSKTFIIWSTFIFVLCLKHIFILSLLDSYVFSHFFSFGKSHTLFKCDQWLRNWNHTLNFLCFNNITITNNVDSISSNQKNDVNYEKWNPYEVIFWLWQKSFYLQSIS
jgi:hypothetical protein